MLHIGAVAAGINCNGTAGRRVFSQLFQRCRATVGLRQKLDRAIEVDFEYAVRARNRFEFAVVVDVGAEAADVGDDFLAGFRMSAQIAWQGNQLLSDFQIHIGQRDVFGNADAFRFFLVAFFRHAQLQIRAVGPVQ